MQEINWNNFKAKFNDKEQKTFEQLCYLLFCKETKQKFGIFRYKNQWGVEAEPIDYDGKMIGFQAKFYDTKLSENKNDIKDSIDKAKSKNNLLNKVIFYTNQEFSESQKKDKKDPLYKIEIEDHAKSLDVEIDWRSKSFFESPFVCEENNHIAQHFFSLEKSTIDLIDELTRHTEDILAAISSKMEFKGNEIKLDRTESIANIKNTLSKSPLSILSGKGGVGKTALIKDYYDVVKNNSPFYIFRATEFNISNANQLFGGYGSFSLSDFIKGHEEFEEKYLVIDSAEKLSDIEYKEVFQEFLTAVYSNNWKVIFTTRHSYLDDLKFQFIEIYRVRCQPIEIDELEPSNLEELSKRYKFCLPGNERLLELFRTPFYLNEYLQNHDSLGSGVTYSEFKNLLWNKQISKTSYKKNNIHIKRETCFLNIAHKRALEGHLFVKADDCDSEALSRLESDEIIKYDSNVGGYFITHDIYEEWALDKIIERAYLNTENINEFFRDICNTLPIRRAFRIWLSEKIISNQDETKKIIESVIADSSIESYWKDEACISALLSEEADSFFTLFESKLLDGDQEFLLRLIFLLRIGCKEVDEELLNMLGVQREAWSELRTIFTKPKGDGWKCAIDFIYQHKEKLLPKKINSILPLINDWNNKNKTGETTKKASQIALYYYHLTIESKYYRSSDKEDQLISVILQGASEVKDELKEIFDAVLSGKTISRRDGYYRIIEKILTSIIDSFELVKTMPSYVIRLADLYWFQNSDELENDYRYSRRMDIEYYFSISSKHLEYYPASAFQTPMLQLLKVSPTETIKFILMFTNKTVQAYADSELDKVVDEVDVLVEESKPIKQYISTRLWCMYRGTQVAPCLLESIHMALERWLLEVAKLHTPETIESWCLYILKNSKSASLTALVLSVALSQPEKLFKVVHIIMQTKEFYLYDTRRLFLDQQAKSQYSIGYGLNYEHEMYQDERLKTCDNAHRNMALEHLVFKYQVSRLADESDDEIQKRKEIIWKIFDQYYALLPTVQSEAESDKTWRLYLARMDTRKMKPEIEESPEGTLIKLNPDIDPELKKHSEDAQREISEKMKYTELHLWANYRFNKEKDKYEKYPQYEGDPKRALSETIAICEQLKNQSDEEFSLFNRSIPAYVCTVLLQEFSDALTPEDKDMCKEIVIAYATLPVTTEGYMYQVSDGTEATIPCLSILTKLFPEEKDKLKIKILQLLLTPSREARLFAAKGVLYYLWDASYDDANTLFWSYLLLAPRFDDLLDKIRKEEYKNYKKKQPKKDVWKIFYDQNKEDLNRVLFNKITSEEVSNYKHIDLEILNAAFELLPLTISDENQKVFLNEIFTVFSAVVLDDEDKQDYDLRHRFLKKYAYFILSLPTNEIQNYLNPFIEGFRNSREMPEFFQEFIFAQDQLAKYDAFWVVWQAFYEKVALLAKTDNSYYSKEILCGYLFAGSPWRKNAQQWHTFKEREIAFFRRTSADMGKHPATLYAISKILNDIGSQYFEVGLSWIAMILKNQNYLTEDLVTNTIYYVEVYMRKYVLKRRSEIRKNASVKQDTLVVLNFLIERGSIVGYLLRDDVL